jgi:two-component system, NarL family, nitrate/nitrite response regulator NarL
MAHRLTPREREIVASLCEGNSNKMIARALNIAEGTVKVHLVNIYRKLGIVRRTRLIALSHIIETTQPAGGRASDQLN